jgi:hypothetical protein
MVGIAGTVATGFLSYRNGVNQIANEREKSATEFLRKERQEAYSAFASEAVTTYLALIDASNSLFAPATVPTLEDFTAAVGEAKSHVGKLNVAGLRVQLVASDDACRAIAREMNGLEDAVYRHLTAARPYVVQRKPPDEAYSKIRITDDDDNALEKLIWDFNEAARVDETDPALRKTSKNCH